MTRNPVRNIFSTFVVWTPVLLIVGGAIWFLALGAMHLEMITYGSEVFVGNNETANLPSWKMGESGGGAGQEAMLLEALNSGDTGRMQSALNQYEASVAAADPARAAAAAKG